jgi:hypothetical protein
VSEEKAKAVEAKVQRLQNANVIREVMYPVWLANCASKEEEWEVENVCGLHRFE